MRKLSLLAMISAVIYLIAGLGILFFQDTFKPLFMGSPADYVTIYPANAILRMITVGLPCAVLGAVNLTGSHSSNSFLPLGTAIYSGIVLGLQSFLGTLFSTYDSAIIAHMKGAMYLANLGIMNQLFSWIDLFVNVALVLLLVESVAIYCKQKN